MKVKDLIAAHLVIFNFGADDEEARAFIAANIGAEGSHGLKTPITKYNFRQIFLKWVKNVLPSINMSAKEWSEFKEAGVLECDFFRADMMSEPVENPENAPSAKYSSISLAEKLEVVLEKDNYKLKKLFSGRLFFTTIDFKDGGEAYRQFWNKYERPPVKEYQNYILDRRDILVPPNIREQKGAFYTPSVVVRKSREYMAKVFGENWQEEYYIWDCAAGSGNLLTDLTNKYNVWASTLDQSDVDTIKALSDIDEHLKLIPEHVFQYDFLNDDFEKLPEGLQIILKDSEKRRKLIFYINPPYGEAASMKTSMGTGTHKPGVAKNQKTYSQYRPLVGAAVTEKFAQFFLRLYEWAPEAHLAAIAPPKYVNLILSCFTNISRRNTRAVLFLMTLFTKTRTVIFRAGF